jgi:hypothetical protein
VDSVHLKGRILPGVPAISVTDLPDVTWQWEERGFAFVFRLRVVESRIDVECIMPDYSPAYLVEIHRRAIDVARAAVNLVAFSHGYGLSLYLDQFVDKAGNVTTLLPEDQKLAPLATALGDGKAIGPLFQLVMTEPVLGQLLNDLIQAVATPATARATCARVVDGIKDLLAPADANDRTAWKQFPEQLRIDEAYVRNLVKPSKPPAKSAAKTAAKTPRKISRPLSPNEAAYVAWAVMNRFLEYRQRGNAPLPGIEFPLLKS